MTRTELTELVVLAQKGDKSAIEQIYLYTRNSVISKAYRETNNIDDAEDILQTCYLTVIEKIGDLKEPEGFEKWFNTLVANKIKDFKKKKSPVLLDGSESDILNSEPETNDAYIPHKALERKDNADTVRELVNELDDKKKQSIEMYYFEGKSVAEIADELDISENTVKSRLHSGRNEINSKSKRSTKKILLTILIIALLIAISLLCVTSSGKYRFSLNLIPTENGWADLNFINHSNDKSYDGIIHVPYEPTYIPAEFELINFDTSSGWMHYHYQGKNDEYLMISQITTVGNSSMFIDNTETTFEFKYLNGETVLFSRRNDNLSYYWTNDTYTFVIHTKTSLPEEEVEKVINGLKPMF